MPASMGAVAVLVLVAKITALAALVQILRGLWWIFDLLFIQPPSDPLRHLPGPDGAKMQNHFREVMDPETSPETHEQWVKEYGKNFRFHGFGSFDYRLMSLDFRVISHVLNSPIYEKPWQTRRIVTRLVGRGIFATEGTEHKILRKQIGPAFSTQAVKASTPIFFQKAEELKDRWDTLMAFAPEKTDSTEEAVIDVAHWVSRATFDVIGLAGFDYAFHSLQHESEEVYLAYRKMFNVADQSPGLKSIANLFFPILEKILPDKSVRQTNASLRTIRRVGKKLIASKKAAIISEKASAKEIQDKDLLSLLIKASLAEDPVRRMSDSDLLDQISNFLFAGSDSTSLAVAWCLHYLSLNPGFQTRLRDELISASPSSSSSSDGTFDDPSAAIEALPLLDAVIKETLRIAPPAHGTIRVATQDDVIPVSAPVVTRNGRATSEIRIRKGSYVHIPIEGLNLSKDIWGEDAQAFNPDRWADLPAPARQQPGLANVMTFSFGPHACPGWKFTIVEMKVFIATLLPHFSFAPAADVRKYNAILTRPYVKDQFELGSTLPLKVSKYQM